ncbi:hypothetical protein ACIQXW_15270 [Lysinibacillus sp. NPDC097162]|uniref:DUF7669 domain-containing protein n=1 Tax=Lysinibacillus sp. NPDC097162 TaxID=3364140 RepID=UPI00382B6488
MLTEKKTCRDELLSAVRNLISSKAKNEFSIKEVVNFMNVQGTGFKKGTIGNHIRYRCCANARKRYHATNYDDLIRLESGLYSLIIR